MSDTNIPLSLNAIAEIVSGFTDSVLLKYKDFPPSDEAVARVAKVRQAALELGASERSLDDWESYLKKAVAGVIEYSEQRIEKFIEEVTDEIVMSHVKKAVDSEKELVVIRDYKNTEDH